jgi:hypothetical protein
VTELTKTIPIDHRTITQLYRAVRTFENFLERVPPEMMAERSGEIGAPLFTSETARAAGIRSAQRRRERAAAV